MSNVKSYLKEMVRKAGSNASMPSTNYIELNNFVGITPDENHMWSTTYTAPCDGFLTVFIQHANETDIDIGLSFFYNGVAELRTGTNCLDNSMSVFVARGVPILIRLHNLRATPHMIWGRFQPTLGCV